MEVCNNAVRSLSGALFLMLVGHQQLCAQFDYQLLPLPLRANAEVSISSLSPAGTNVLVEFDTGMAIWHSSSKDYSDVDFGTGESEQSVKRCVPIDESRLLVLTSDNDLFVWQRGKSKVNLRGPPMEYDKLQALQGNNSQVIGQAVRRSSHEIASVVWSAATGEIELLFDSNNSTEIAPEVWAMNSSGVIVGNKGSSGWYYDSRTKQEHLISPVGKKFKWCRLQGITKDGFAVGIQDEKFPFVWTVDGGIQLLECGADVSATSIFGISDTGTVFGSIKCRDTNDQYQLVTWDGQNPSKKFISVREQLKEQDKPVELADGISISGDGKMLVWIKENESVTRAILVPVSKPLE